MVNSREVVTTDKAFGYDSHLPSLGTQRVG